MALMITLGALVIACIGCLVGVSLAEQAMDVRSRRHARYQRELNAAWRELRAEQEAMRLWRAEHEWDRPMGTVVCDPFCLISTKRGKRRSTNDHTHAKRVATVPIVRVESCHLAKLTPATDQLLDAFKYHADPTAGSTLSASLASLLDWFTRQVDLTPSQTVLTWVPTFRGPGSPRFFDHLERLLRDDRFVQPLLQRVGLRQPRPLLDKIRNTPKMAHVRFLEPRNKTRLTIDIARSLRIDQNNSHSLQGYNLVILDDVIGTHTTLDACISVLSSLEPSFVFSLALFKREVENRG